MDLVLLPKKDKQTINVLSNYQINILKQYSILVIKDKKFTFMKSFM